MNSTQYIIQLSETPVTDFGKKNFSAQPETQKVFTSVFGSSGAIMMDGFIGYFTNSDGESAHYCAQAYQEIGSPSRADIIERACAVVSDSPIPERDEERQELISGLSEEQTKQLDDLSEEFMELREAIDPLLLDYVRKHPEAFGPVPESID